MFTKQPVYGNHIGIVINDNDPENRGRVQVFVPHLSMTLFKGWNSSTSDLTLGPGWLDKLDISLQTRLMRGLPWAETAFPIFGGNGSVSNNSQTNQTQVIRQPSASNSHTIINRDGTPQTKPATGKGEIKVTSYGWYTDGKKQTERTLDTPSAAGIGNADNWLDPKGSVALSPDLERKLAELNPSLSETINVKGQSILRLKNNTILQTPDGRTYKKNDSTDSSPGYRFDIYRSPISGYNDINNKPSSLNVDDIIVKPPQEVAATGALAAVKAAGFSGTQDWMKQVSSELSSQGITLDRTVYNSSAYYGIPSGTDPQKLADALLKSPSYQKVASKNPYYVAAGGTSGGTNSNSTTPVEATVESTASVLDKNDSTVSHASGSTGNVSNPGGVKSKPKRGTMVWVFFVGGDIMRPVYFAGVSEPNSESRTNDGNVPIQLTGPTNTRTKSLSSGGSNAVSDDNTEESDPTPTSSYVLQYAGLDLFSQEGSQTKLFVEKLLEDKSLPESTFAKGLYVVSYPFNNTTYQTILTKETIQEILGRDNGTVDDALKQQLNTTLNGSEATKGQIGTAVKQGALKFYVDLTPQTKKKYLG